MGEKGKNMSRFKMGVLPQGPGQKPITLWQDAIVNAEYV